MTFYVFFAHTVVTMIGSTEKRFIVSLFNVFEQFQVNKMNHIMVKTYLNQRKEEKKSVIGVYYLPILKTD